MRTQCIIFINSKLYYNSPNLDVWGYQTFSISILTGPVEPPLAGYVLMAVPIPG